MYTQQDGCAFYGYFVNIEGIEVPVTKQRDIDRPHREGVWGQNTLAIERHFPDYREMGKEDKEAAYQIVLEHWKARVLAGIYNR